jgi:hypothetical protein
VGLFEYRRSVKRRVLAAVHLIGRRRLADKPDERHRFPEGLVHDLEQLQKVRGEFNL